jgi:hypothetical protein
VGHDTSLFGEATEKTLVSQKNSLSTTFSALVYTVFTKDLLMLQMGAQLPTATTQPGAFILRLSFLQQQASDDI